MRSGVNFLRTRCTNFVNLSSSLVISVVLPREKPCSASSLEIGTLSERYSFRWKYTISSISPRLEPPGSVVISVPRPPSRRGRLEVFQHTHMITVISYLTCRCIIHQLVTITIHHILEILLCLYLSKLPTSM